MDTEQWSKQVCDRVCDNDDIMALIQDMWLVGSVSIVARFQCIQYSIMI